MFIMFEGTPGSGKTYEAIIRLVDNLRLGRTVWTNIEGVNEKPQREQIKYLAGLSDYELETQLHFIPEHEIYTFYKTLKNGAFIILDEVHKYFGNRDWASGENKAFNSWGSTHRHHGHDVLLLSQGIEKLDAHVRGLIEWTYRFKKNNMFGSAAERSYRMTAFYQDDTAKPIDRPKIKTYKKKYFGCYKSYIGADVKELKIMPNINILKHPIFYLIPLVLLFTLYMFFFKSSISSGDLFGAQKTLSKYSQSSKDLKAGVAPVGLPNIKQQIKTVPAEDIFAGGQKQVSVHPKGVLPVHADTSSLGKIVPGGEDRKFCGFVVIDDVRKDILCKPVANKKSGVLSSFVDTPGEASAARETGAVDSPGAL